MGEGKDEKGRKGRLTNEVALEGAATDSYCSAVLE